MCLFYTRDGRYGLSAPARGGLDLLDLHDNNNSGAVVMTLIPRKAQGIFNVKAMFNATDEYVLYHHSGQKNIRMFRVSDGTLLADYALQSELRCWVSSADGQLVIFGSADGSLTTLVIADPQKKEAARRYLRELPSRQVTPVTTDTTTT